MAMLVAFVGYVTGGVAIGWARDQIRFLNEDFWEEVRLSIKEALIAVVSACGGRAKAAFGTSPSDI
jgi:hypothetical protein